MHLSNQATPIMNGHKEQYPAISRGHSDGAVRRLRLRAALASPSLVTFKTHPADYAVRTSASFSFRFQVPVGGGQNRGCCTSDSRCSLSTRSGALAKYRPRICAAPHYFQERLPNSISARGTDEHIAGEGPGGQQRLMHALVIAIRWPPACPHPQNAGHFCSLCVD